MAGQSAGRSISSTKSDIDSVCEHSDLTYGAEGSKIGGEGRQGGAPAPAPNRDIRTRYNIGGGEAKRGETGYNSGSGKS